MCCSGERGFYFLLHAYAGLLVLGLIVMRLLFRVLFPWPKPVKKGSWFGNLASALTHWALYGLALFIPLSGWIVASSFGCCVGVPGLPDINLLSSAMNDVGPANASVAYRLHVTFAWLILALIMVHVLAAMLHHFVFRNETLAKMLPGSTGRGKQDGIEKQPRSEGRKLSRGQT